MPNSDSDFDCSSPTTMTKASISFVGDNPAVDTGPDSLYTGTTMDYDALSEVLSWMPAKSAIKYSSSICRPLHNIHSVPGFVEKQCLHSHGRDTAFFLHPVYGSSSLSSVEFHALPSPDSSGIPPESLDSIRHRGSIAASSNGLLLLARKSGADFLSARCSSSDVEFSVCNPATGALASLPAPAGYNILLRDGAFGYSSLIECCSGTTTNSFPNDYNIALLVETEPDTNILFDCWGRWRRHLLIYANGKWEEDLCDVDVRGRDLRFDMPVAVYSKATEGLVVHYLCDDSQDPCIVAFDIRKKWLWRSIKLPDMDDDRGGKSYDRLWIFKWNETGICLVRRFMGVFQVWALDECGGLRCSESWRRVMEKTEEEMGLDSREEKVESFGIASGRGLLVATKARVYVYVMEGENRGRLEVVGEYKLGGLDGGVKFTSYANTLRPVCV